MNMCDQYNFKILKKLIACEHVLTVIQKFQLDSNTYFITEYVQSNLLKQQLKQPHQIFQLSKALQLFSKIVQIIEEIHQNNIIYRNLRLQTVSFQKNQLFLSDFTLSQIVKRRQRYFQIIGVPHYLAPQFYLEDGYGYQIDIWAAGVCLFYMIAGCYPFNFQNNNEEQILKQIQSKCKKGFDFASVASQSKKAKYIQSSKSLQDLFKRIFQMDYTTRIKIQELKLHPAIKQYFTNEKVEINSQIMSVIQQETYSHQSIFMSMLSNYSSHHQFHKQEVILDFMEHSSEVLMLDSPDKISEELRTLVNFSILKVAMIKVTNLIDIFYGKKQSQFKIPANEWQQMKKTAAFTKVKHKIQKKKKIIQMLYRAACINVKNYIQKSLFYSKQIGEDFSLIKHEYRKNLSKMFEAQKEIMKKKQKKEIVRKTCENMARLTILWMINRVFQEQNLRQNFKLYYEWSRKQSLQDLEEWIQNQKINNLKIFIKNILNRYMQ